MSVVGETLNVVAGAPWPAGLLSNLAETPFLLWFDGEVVVVRCVEGPLQALKFPPTDPRRRQQTLRMNGEVAKRMSHAAAKAHGRKWVWWQKERGTWEKAPYGGEVHRALLAGFLRAKFAKETGNQEARLALLASVGCKLIHDLGHPEGRRTSLPAEDFVGILTDVRREIFEGQA